MSGRIVTIIINNNPYVYYKRSYRVKIDPGKTGKTRNTGKSKVATDSKYLGKPEDVLKKLSQQSEDNKIEYDIGNFGLEAALYEVARSIGLPQLLERNFPGHVSGIKISDYLLTVIINRVCEPKPKTQIREYIRKGILGKIMRIEPSKLTSQNYWLAYDKIISEKDLKEKRKEIITLRKQKLTKELKKKIAEKELGFIGLEKIDAFQIELFESLMEKEKIHADKLFIDSTNFYNYIENLNDKTLLCAKGKNKAGKTNLNQITLMMSIIEEYGIPLLHEIYKGNYNDMTLFPHYLTKLIENYVNFRNKVSEIYICYDKGNNSKDNYATLKQLEKDNNIKIHVVGSLRGDHNKDLLRIPLKKYENVFDDFIYYATEKDVFDGNKKIVITYSKKRAKRERRIFKQKLKKYIDKLHYYFDNLTEKTKQKKTEEDLKETMEKRLVPYNPYKNILKPRIKKVGNTVRLTIELDNKILRDLYRTYGKTIIFSSSDKLTNVEIIKIYYSKNKMDRNHKLLKCPEGVLFHPNWVWTDSKLKVQAFVNIEALTLFKLLEKRFNESKSIYKLNAIAIKELLKEIKMILVVKDTKKGEITTNKLNSIQKELFKVFNLKKYLN